jgi:hypothetical protein
MKKTIYLAAFAGALAFSGAAFAAGKNETAPNSSPCGAAHGAFANENGNFGFLGQDYSGRAELSRRHSGPDARRDRLQQFAHGLSEHAQLS